MYGLPRDINLGFFKGRTLLQMCFGVYDLILNFDGHVIITVTSSIGYSVSNGNPQRYGDFCLAAPSVLTLLNQKVLAAEGNDAGTLTLVFEGGTMLAIYDDSKQYESYTIGDGKQLIVV